jgi:hypothetical protein
MQIMQNIKIIIPYVQLLAIILSILMITSSPILGTLFYTRISLLLKAVNYNCKDSCSLLVYTIEVIPYLSYLSTDFLTS